MPDAACKTQTSRIHVEYLKVLMVKNWHRLRSCHPSSCEAFLLSVRVQILQKRGEKLRGILFPETSKSRSQKPVELETSLNPQNFSRD